jgi:O-antigen/teichoic acid export membrane protein
LSEIGPPPPTPDQPSAPVPDAQSSSVGGRARLGFLGHVNFVFLTYTANAALLFGVTVVLARALGPDGRGVYALFLLSASISQAILGLGMNVSAVYFLGKRAFPLPRVVANGQQVALLAAAISATLVLIAWPVLGGWFAGRDVPYWAFAFAVPLFADYNFITTVLQGLSRFLAMNAVIIAQPLILVVLLAAGELAGDVDTTDAVLYWCAATAAATALGLALVGRDGLRLPELLRFDAPSLGAQVRFGVQGQLGNLAQLLNYRVDQYVVLLFVDTAAVGIYAVAVAVGQSVWFLANAVAAVLLPRLTAEHEDEAARTTALVCRNTLLVSALGALALGGISPWLIPTFFTSDFGDAVRPLLWLLPGTVVLAGSKVLSSYIFSQGRPLTNSLITLASMAVTLIADFALIPPFGIGGAAAASTIAYTTHFVLSLRAYRDISGRPVWEAVLVRREDLRRYIEIARQRLASASP